MEDDTDTAPSTGRSSGRRSSRSTEDGGKGGKGKEEGKGKEDVKEDPGSEEKKMREFEIQAGCLTAAEKKERVKLENEGFGTWQKRHFLNFITACETYGRKKKDLIIHAVADKPAQEVKRYWEVFWNQYTELKDHKKYIRRIEAGEQKIQKRAESQKIVEKKVAKYKNPWLTLKVPYTSNRHAYSPEEDRWMLCMLAQMGYGQWDQLKSEIRQAWQFRFDWYIKSRTTKELEKRCDSLIQLLMAEAKEEAANARKTDKRKTSNKKPAAKKRKKR